MVFFARLFQRAGISALCMMLVLSCRSPKPRQWEIQEILTQTPCFNAGRLLLPPDPPTSLLELEILRNHSGIRCYLNLHSIEAMPCSEDPACTCLEILFENQEPWVVYPYLLGGGQRLLLPGEAADVLIQALLEESSFTIRMGGGELFVISNQFAAVYEKLLSIGMDDGA